MAGTQAQQLDPALVGMVGAGGVVVLTGAGISTASGIPDYRGPTGRNRTSPPMQWEEFAGSAHARRRYWARGQVGYRRYEDVRPNVAHRAVAAFEDAGLVQHVVTQNVDGLHQAAGSRSVTELHGSLAEVVCMACGRRESRAGLQARQAADNPWIEEVRARAQADGDAVVDEDVAARFRPAGCLACDGDLRPDVVFFGEFVPRERVERAREAVEAAAALVVLGSSLAVGSGYLLVRRAVRRGVPVAVVNRGPTRGDDHADVRVDADLTRVLPALASALGLGPAG
jgi:NAD-dependent SIR2 family protein deacetylase